jgi:hypothetical protein
MSTTFTERSTTETTAAYGGLVDAIGGIATVVLAIIGLAGIHTDVLMPIAIIVFGAALLIQGGTMLSEFASVPFASAEQFGASGVSTVFLVGAAGIVLGVLALIGIGTSTLVSVSVIAFGAALLISSNSVRQLGTLRAAMLPAAGAVIPANMASEMASGSAAVQLLAGLTAIVLGILAVVGIHAGTLVAAALIVVGAAIVLSGSTLTGAVMSFMPAERQSRTHVLP